jgi:5-methylthioribose kinase
MFTGPDKGFTGKIYQSELCKIQEDFVFTHPYGSTGKNNWGPILDVRLKPCAAIPS